MNLYIIQKVLFVIICIHMIYKTTGKAKLKIGYY
jgi:hypothetical protein